MENGLMENLNLSVGNEEAQKLMPAEVEIVGVNVVEILTKKGKAEKVNFQVNHPASKDTVQVSSIKYEKGNELKISGTWLNKDSKGLIQKGSPIAILMAKVGAKTLAEMLKKRIGTIADDKGYLAFKAY